MLRILILINMALISIGQSTVMAADSTETRVISPDKKTSIKGKWKIILGDKRIYSFGQYDDSTWDTIELPGNLVRYSMRKGAGYKGILWLRKSIHISKQLKGHEIGLILGRIANADETYFNGVKIGGLGKFPPHDLSMWNHPRNYLIPSGLIHYGSTNTIAIRVSYDIYGEVTGELSVTDYESWFKDKTAREFSLIIHAYLILGLAVLLFIIFFTFYIFRPHDQEYLFYCLQIIPGFFIILDLCSNWKIFPSTFFRLQIVGISWVALNVTHLIFLHRIYQLKRVKTELLLWSYLIVWTILVFLFAEKDPLLYGKILIILCITLGFYHIFCHVYALIKKRPFAKLFSFFGTTVVLCAMHDGLVYLSKFYGITISFYGYAFNRMIFHYGASILFLGTALVLVFRFLMLMDEVDDLNTNLENYIIENALLEKKIGQKKKTAEIMITQESEQKIRKIIDYINDNYSYNISREGLASSINIHPDNLSKLFNAYKKMRIGDYINELRIKDAADKLISGDESISDIAFSVGFESLRTFNRAFAKSMNITPEKYRREYSSCVPSGI